MKRIIRDRPLSPEEAAKYDKIREQVAAELPDLISRHHGRMAAQEARENPPAHRPPSIPSVSVKYAHDGSSTKSNGWGCGRCRSASGRSAASSIC